MLEIVSAGKDSDGKVELGPQMGGAGFIHYNNTVEEQVEQAVRAKRHVPGCLFQPPTLSPSHTLRDYDNLVVCFPSCLGACTVLLLSFWLDMSGSFSCMKGGVSVLLQMRAWHMCLPSDSRDRIHQDVCQQLSQLFSCLLPPTWAIS